MASDAPPPPPPPPQPEAASTRHHAYSRKQKSLGLLCSKYFSLLLCSVFLIFLIGCSNADNSQISNCSFIALYDREGVTSVGLDDAASRLGFYLTVISDLSVCLCVRFGGSNALRMCRCGEAADLRYRQCS